MPLWPYSVLPLHSFIIVFIFHIHFLLSLAFSLSLPSSSFIALPLPSSSFIALPLPLWHFLNGICYSVLSSLLPVITLSSHVSFFCCCWPLLILVTYHCLFILLSITYSHSITQIYYYTSISYFLSHILYHFLLI